MKLSKMTTKKAISYFTLGLISLVSCGTVDDNFCIQYCDKDTRKTVAIESTHHTSFASASQNYLEHANTEAGGLPLLIQPKKPFTISFYYKKSSASSTGSQHVISNGTDGAGFSLEVQDTKIFVNWGDNTNYLEWTTQATGVSEAAWTHVVVVYSGGDLGVDASAYSAATYHKTLNFYINGSKLVQSTDAGFKVSGRNFGTSATELGGSPFRLGGNADKSKYGDFLLDEVTVWNTNFTDEDVSELYNDGENYMDPTRFYKKDSLYAWWRMGEGEDTTTQINDMSGNNRHFTGLITTAAN